MTKNGCARVLMGALAALAAGVAACGMAAADDRAARPAKQLFGRISAPAGDSPEVHGGYARGCLAGATRLAADGPGWQIMRLSRNRAWAHPDLAAFIIRLGARAMEIGWPGLLVGDLAQPIGGPMLGGHASHQTGIDGDIWLQPAPARSLGAQERESISAVSVVAADRKSLNGAWTPRHHAVLRAAAEDPAMARIFVNGAIKQRLCQDAAAAGEPMDWLRKIRPWYGHREHFHVRLNCPAGSSDCVAQNPPPEGDGCAEVAWWLSDEVLHPKPDPNWKPKPPLTLADLPDACGALLEAANR